MDNMNSSGFQTNVSRTASEKAGRPRIVRPGAYCEITRRIAAFGPMTFAEFMGLALYWHDGGYYASSGPRWGASGDYITSIDVSPVFSRTIAKQVEEVWRILGRPSGFELIEAGAGRGWLSIGVLDALARINPVLRRTMKTRLVERNPRGQKVSIEGATWHETVKELTPVENAMIVSNELVDSLPVHIVEYNNGMFLEVRVDHDGHSFREVLMEPSTPALEKYFVDSGITLANGQRAEVNLIALDWLRAASGLMQRGFIATIDYGLPARELYAHERRGGTLHCHYKHKMHDNPYQHVGGQDITSFVDFTALARTGSSVGLEVTGFTTQKNFLLGLGILDATLAPEDVNLENYAKIRHNQLIKELIMPGGMGDTFKVLVQHKGINNPRPRLAGFSFKDMKEALFKTA